MLSLTANSRVSLANQISSVKGRLTDPSCIKVYAYIDDNVRPIMSTLSGKY